MKSVLAPENQFSADNAWARTSSLPPSHIHTLYKSVVYDYQGNQPANWTSETHLRMIAWRGNVISITLSQVY